MNALTRWRMNRRLSDPRHVRGHVRHGVCVDPEAHGLPDYVTAAGSAAPYSHPQLGATELRKGWTPRPPMGPPPSRKGEDRA